MSIGAGLSRLVSEMETVKRERDEFAAKILQLRKVLAETARGLLTQPYERDNARSIARLLGYTNQSDDQADVDAFLSSVSVEDPKT